MHGNEESKSVICHDMNAIYPGYGARQLSKSHGRAQHSTIANARGPEMHEPMELKTTFGMVSEQLLLNL